MTATVTDPSGDVLERFRTVLGLFPSLRAAAAVAEVTAETVANWRDGRTKIPLEAACALAKAAGLDPAWLVGGDASAAPREPDKAAAGQQEAPLDPLREVAALTIYALQERTGDKLALISIASAVMLSAAFAGHRAEARAINQALQALIAADRPAPQLPNPATEILP